MKHADKLKRLEQFQKLKASGQSVPWLENPPEVDAFHHFIWNGWIVLCSQRQSSERPQPLRVSDIAAYLSLVGRADEDDREDFFEVILALDSVFMRHVQEAIDRQNRKAEISQKAAAAKSARPSRQRRR